MRQQTTRSWGTVPGQRRGRTTNERSQEQLYPYTLGEGSIELWGDSGEYDMAIVMVGLALRCFWSMELGWGGGMVFSFGLFLSLCPLMNSLPMHTSHYAFPRFSASRLARAGWGCLFTCWTDHWVGGVDLGGGGMRGCIEAWRQTDRQADRE